MKIPVFTVLKKGNIIKNIFLNNPPSNPDLESPKESGIDSDKSGLEGKTVLVGRHPDCHIVLDHPSISRFHLQICSQPSLQKISVIDLSSVHGTWVSEKKIQPQVPVELKDDDTLRFGASTRIYKLQWIPLSCAFEIENPKISPAAPIPEENGEVYQDENFILPEKKQDDSWAMQIPSAPPIPESMNSSSPSEENLKLEEASLFFAHSFLERENHSLEQKDALNILAAPHKAESVSSSIPLGVLSAFDTHLKIENCSPEAHFATEVLSEGENHSPPIRSGQRDISSLLSRRGKSVSFLRIHKGKCMSSGVGIKAEDQTEYIVVEQEKRQETLCKVLFPGAGEEDESIPSDKENTTRKIPLSLKSKKEKAEIQHPNLLKSSSKDIIANSDVEEDSIPSDKENMTPNFSYESKSKKPTSENQRRIKPEMMIKRRADRNQSVDQAIRKVGESKRKWNMVVDTSCLLNEESRRSLKLLEGLKGTYLIIPRMVIRELDCLKRRESWFRKDGEASSILQWIEECMVKMRWWIHVQSSAEGMPIAPTPPASPRSRLSEGSNEFGTANLVPFSTCGSLMEIVSPTAEDHILECALLFKRIKNDGQVVLLTNDIALKIKAMAEGLICETAKEFRDSLVNPYSQRFLWVESTPIGPTWSCMDEAGLKENFHYCPPIRKTAKTSEGAKGLKLILRYNSHYRQINPVK